VKSLPPKAARRALLRSRGWVRIGSRGSETWQHSRFSSSCFFTLAAAYRVETGLWADERPPLDESQELVA
jgi:hypothetical protein